MASNILPLFWNLASSSKDARLTASVDLISTLEGFQQAHVQARAGESESDNDDEDEDEDDEEDEDDDDESGVEVDGSDDEQPNGLSYGESIRKLDSSLAKDNAEDVAYTVKRLVRGLASSRESSRFGFSVALTELLQRTPSVTPGQVLSLIMRNSHTSKAMKGSEERDALFARLFGVIAIVQSGALWRSSLEEYDDVIDALVVLGDKKNWLRESAWWGILHAAQGLTESKVEWRGEAVRRLTTLLKKGWTQEKLALALSLEKAEPNLDWKEIAYPAIRHTPILSSQNLPTLAKILKDSQAAEDDNAPSTSQGSWKPQLHFVWTQIFDALLGDSGVAGQASYQDFFRSVVDESLLANTASPQKRFWGFQVFISSLPRVDADIMPQLFTPNFMRCWMNNLSSQDRYLHKAAQQTANIVQDVAKANPKVGFALLSRLIGKHGRADFDKVTKTKTVERILSNLNEEGVREYVGYLKGVVVKDDDSDSADAKSLGERRKWAIEQLSSLVRNAKVPKSDDRVSDVLDFLLIHGLFIVKSSKPSKASSLAVSAPKPPLSTASTNVCRERFFAAILDLTTASPPREGEKRREQGRNDEGKLWLRRALEVIQKVEKDEKAFEAVVDVDGEIRKMRGDAMTLLDKVSSLGARQARNEVLIMQNTKQSADTVKACEVLLSYAILQTYEERADMLETLEDVTSAVQAMFAPKPKAVSAKKGKSKKHDHDHEHEAEEEDPEAIDLLIDTLIALLDKGSGGLRSLATMVLALSAPALTASTIEHLLAQLDAAPGTVEGPEIDAEELEEHDEDEGSDDESEQGDDDEAEDDDEEDEEESEEESEEEAEEDMGDVDPAFRKRVEEALRAAGMDPEGDGNGDVDGEGDDDEDESSDEEIWDDEQMMKVDEHLAKVFRDRKEGNSKQKAKRMVTDNVHFKTRILDLFDTYIRKQSSNPLVLDTVMPLLRLVRRSGDEAVLSTKTSGIIRSRFDKPKEVPTTDVARATAILGEVHNFARRANSNELASAAASCSLFVARSIAQSDPKSTAVAETYAATVNDYMTRKGSLVRVPFMRDYIKRFPLQAWPMRKDVLDFLQQGKGHHPFRQLQMYELVAAFASHLGNIAQSVPAQEVEAFVRDVRVAVYDTIQRVAASGAADGEGEKEKEKDGWKTAWLKDVARHALHVLRSSKSVLSPASAGEAGAGKMKDIWAADELDKLLETVQEGKTAKMTGLIQLVKQLRAVLESDPAKQGKKGNKRKAQAEPVDAAPGDVEMDGQEAEEEVKEKEVKKGKKQKVAKEGKEGKAGKVKKAKAA